MLPVVTTLAVAAPVGAFALSDSTDYRSTNESQVAAVPTQLAEVALTSVPDITVPLRDLTGLDLPDLRLSDLQMLPLPTSIPVPPGLPVPPGVALPTEIPLPAIPTKAQPTTTTAAPAPAQQGNAPAARPPVPSTAVPTAPPAAPTTTSAAPAPIAPAAPAPDAPAATTTTTTAAPAPAAPATTPPAGAPVVQNRPTGMKFIADPANLEPGTTPETPALSPGAVGPDLIDQVGAQVKELTQETPFSMVAVTARDLVNTTTKLRARQLDGNWGPWYDADPVDTRATDQTPADAPTGTEPIYVGETTAVQMLVTRKPVAGADHSDPAHLTEAALKAILINPGRAAIDAGLTDVAAALPGGGPKVITRAQWGADESIRCEEPTYDDGVGGITVHHTAGRNDYSRAESAGIVRAIYAYHAETLGWCDIGYNALVDQYGQIFEGRYGGLDRAVQGAHAGGFNENTAGVALMGNYETETPSNESINAIGKFIGWRSKIAGIDPEGHTTMYSEGTEFTPYAQDEAVDLPTVFAHRDVGNTDCPGDAAYALMDRIRGIAAGNSSTYSSPATPERPPSQQARAPQQQGNMAELGALVDKLLGLSGSNEIARHWVSRGGVDGPLGAPQSDLLSGAQGRQYAKFANGYVFSGENGAVFEVVGAILDRYLSLGGDSGVLGLPTGSAYLVPDGLRADFQNGSLVLNELTGIVTTFWKTYNETYKAEMEGMNGTKPEQAPATTAPTSTVPAAPGAPAPTEPVAPQVPAEPQAAPVEPAPAAPPVATEPAPAG
ncbi:N-acetylmuramoyl-L-alanine amidase [Nocardia sp. NPDC087230]|uniref:N-acetylmuramoyl-L-alanine amidase n=2 Tax=unclassified Nocardia TaxID=2637762 RepID=UPI0038282B10